MADPNCCEVAWDYSVGFTPIRKQHERACWDSDQLPGFSYKISTQVWGGKYLLFIVPSRVLPSITNERVNTYIMDEKAIYCSTVRLYFYKPQASENMAQECNIHPYCLLTHQITDLLYTTQILVAPRRQTILHMRGTKVVVACNLSALFLALDATSTSVPKTIS